MSMLYVHNGLQNGLLCPQAMLIKVELNLTADKFNFVIVTKEGMQMARRFVYICEVIITNNTY